MITGKKITLIPATLGDRQAIYEWCFHSETTKSHIGPPDYPDMLIPTFQEFCDDYEDYYFTGVAPRDGQGFIISHDKTPVGFISYASSHLKPHISELDIWMNCEANCGRGFGTDAIVALGDYLNQTMGVCELIMAPAAKNVRAIQCYQKAGFEVSSKPMCDYLLEEYISQYGGGDYGEDETVVLVKRF